MKKALKWGIVTICLIVAFYCARNYISKVIREQLKTISCEPAWPVNPEGESTSTPSGTEFPDIADEK